MGNNGSVPENYGFKIVEIISRSPGEKAGLIVEADFILTVNGKKLRKLHPDQIKELVQSNEDKELKLKVFNSTTGQIRDVTIVPTKNWPGQGLLGVKIRLEPYGDLNVEVSIAVRLSLPSTFFI
jgi:S1-C subfamily serine protease